MNNEQSHIKRPHRPRTIPNTQPIAATQLPRDIRKSVHIQLFDLGQSPREVANRYALRDCEVVSIAIEIEREIASRRVEQAWKAGRRSLLTPPPATIARRAA